MIDKKFDSERRTLGFRIGAGAIFLAGAFTYGYFACRCSGDPALRDYVDSPGVEETYLEPISYDAGTVDAREDGEDLVMKVMYDSGPAEEEDCAAVLRAMDEYANRR